MRSDYFYLYKEVGGKKHLDWFTLEGLIMTLFENKYYVFNIDYAFIIDYDDCYETFNQFMEADINKGTLIVEFETRKRYSDKFEEHLNRAMSKDDLVWFVNGMKSTDVEMIINVIIEENKLISMKDALTGELKNTVKEIDNDKMPELREMIIFDRSKNKFDLKKS